ncbi:MAG: hypothetical protein AB7F96_16050 [Beijerinckiaceae bacterium]
MPTLFNQPILAAAVAAAILPFAPQEAFARYNCAIKPTRDGFVALRQAASPGGKLIARMKKGELVGLLHPPDFEKLIRKDNWIYVVYHAGVQFEKAHESKMDKGVSGWVNNSLIACHE